MPDFHEGRVFRPAPIIEDAPVEMTETSSVEPAADIKNDIEERAKDLAWDMLPAELKDNLMQAATTAAAPVSETSAVEEEAKSYGGAVDPVELRDDNLEDMGRRLILWSHAVAPVVRPLSRAEGGSVSDTDDKDEKRAKAVTPVKPAASIINKALSVIS